MIYVGRGGGDAYGMKLSFPANVSVLLICIVLVFWDLSSSFDFPCLQPSLNGMKPTRGFCVGDVQ